MGDAGYGFRTLQSLQRARAGCTASYAAAATASCAGERVLLRGNAAPRTDTNARWVLVPGPERGTGALRWLAGS